MAQVRADGASIPFEITDGHWWTHGVVLPAHGLSQCFHTRPGLTPAFIASTGMSPEPPPTVVVASSTSTGCHLKTGGATTVLKTGGALEHSLPQTEGEPA
jgi:hypothetical protein